MIDVTYDELKNAVRKKGYAWFGGLYNLNVVGIRKNTAIPDAFDDTFAVAYEGAGGIKRVFLAPFTADPGLYYLQNPINAKGAAIMKPGQYRGAYVPGLHRGYSAFIQYQPVTVYRDGNRNNRLDFAGKEDTGMFGINIHRTLADGLAATVGFYSAGCQVLQSDVDFQYIRELVRWQKRHVGTSVFTYTLLWESDIPLLR